MPTTRSSHRRLAAGAVALVTTAILALVAHPAFAVDEFPPDPYAHAEVRCTQDNPNQAEIGVQLGNSASGQSDAHFEVWISTLGEVVEHYTDTLPVDEHHIEFFPVVDDQEYTIVVDSLPAISQETFVLSNDCADPPTGNLTYSCWETGPVLLAAFESHDPAGYDIQVTDGFNPPYVRDDFVGSTWHAFTEPEDTAVSAQMSYADRPGPGSTTMAALEFETDCTQPRGEIRVECTADGPALTLTLAGDDLQDMSYHLVHGNGVSGDVTLPWGTGDLTVTKTITEDEPYALTASFDGSVVAAFAGTPDCVQPAATIEHLCVDGQPGLVTTLAADDLQALSYDVEQAEGQTAVVVVEPGAPAVIHEALIEDAEFSAAVRHGDVVLAEAHGQSDCAREVPPPTAPPAVASPPTTAAPTLPVVAPGPAPISDTAAVAAPTDTGPLPVTGDNSLPLATAGGLLTALGLVLYRVSRRAALR